MKRWEPRHYKDKANYRKMREELLGIRTDWLLFTLQVALCWGVFAGFVLITMMF
jgi:hypothetical protein